MIFSADIAEMLQTATRTTTIIVIIIMMIIIVTSGDWNAESYAKLKRLQQPSTFSIQKTSQRNVETNFKPF